MIISNEERKVKSLEESDLLRKGVSEAIENKAKEQKGGFLNLSLVSLGASLLESILKELLESILKEYFIKELFELVEEHLEQVKIFNVTSSFNEL